MVTTYPDVNCLGQNIFFLDHKFKESEIDIMMSKLNVEEAMLVVRFAVFILQHGYYAKQITILTLYTG